MSRNSTETPESILRQELKANRRLMERVRQKLEQELERGEIDPETLAKILTALSNANATTAKIVGTGGSAEEEMSPEKVLEKLLGKG